MTKALIIKTTALVLMGMVFFAPFGLLGQVMIINDDHHDHNQVYFNKGEIISPGESNNVEISGSSRIIYTSFEKILLMPGFKADSLTGDGSFKANISEEGFTIQRLYPDTSITSINTFQKLELGLILPEHIRLQVDSFMLNPPNSVYDEYDGLNPFDPADISVEARFTNLDYPGIPDKKTYGFYMKEFAYINPAPGITYWAENGTIHNWRIRFSPDLAGNWQANVFISFKGHPELDSLLFQSFDFTCVESSNPGFIEPNENNPRMLKFSGSGDQFFGIGLNIAWPEKWTDSPYGYYNVVEPSRFQSHRNDIRKLAQGEGNFSRIVSSSFDYNFEWELLNFYDSKFNNDSIPWGSEAIEGYEEVGRQALAYELDSLFMVCEEVGVYLVYCLEYHYQFGSSHPGYPGFANYPYSWPKNPYNSIADVDSAADFFTNENARLRYKNKLRYIFARWGYSTAIMGFELLSEIDQINCTGAYGEDGAKAWEYCPYKDTTAGAYQFRSDLQSWHYDMYEHIRSKDHLDIKNHMISTSYAGLPKSPDTIFEFMDFSSLHAYRRLPSKNKANFNRYKDRLLEAPELWNKPFYFGEMGLSGSSILGCNALGYYACDDLSFHNDSWASAMFSGISQGMHWWWNKGILDDHLGVLSNLKIFFNAINLKDNNFTQIGSNWGNSLESEDVTFEYYYSHTENKDVIFGWVHNYEVHWQNMIYNHQDCLTDEIADWDSSCIPESQVIIDPVDATITIYDVQIGAVYALQIFNTRTGEFKPIQNLFALNSSINISFGTLGNDPDNVLQPPDYGFILTKLTD